MGPEFLPLRYGQARPAAESSYVSIGFPGIQLPCVHDILPFAYQESGTECVYFQLVGCIRQTFPDYCPRCDFHGAKLCFI